MITDSSMALWRAPVRSVLTAAAMALADVAFVFLLDVARRRFAPASEPVRVGSSLRSLLTGSRL